MIYQTTLECKAHRLRLRMKFVFIELFNIYARRQKSEMLIVTNLFSDFGIPASNNKTIKIFEPKMQ